VKKKQNGKKSGIKKNLGKVSPTFPTALFLVDARFAHEIKRPQAGMK